MKYARKSGKPTGPGSFMVKQRLGQEISNPIFYVLLNKYNIKNGLCKGRLPAESKGLFEEKR